MLALNSRYEVIGTGLGGGMGDITICRDKNLDRKVIIKTLKPGQDDRRLLDERKALLKLRSKHVVQLHDILQLAPLEHGHAIVLEYIEGHDLDVGQFPVALEHLRIIWQIACGLLAIHEQDIIHRDIKHNNIRLDNSGVVKILDFGLARTAGPDAKTLSAIGTPGFMAPELWTTRNVSFDKSIDVYAFAVTAIYLHTPDIPPELEHWPPQPIRPRQLGAYLPHVPNEILELLEAALSHNPLDRPKIGEIELLLRRHLLQNQHRGLLVLGNEIHEVHAQSPAVTVRSADRGALGIKYDGTKFIVSSVLGNVAVNNLPARMEQELPDCCVIAFGIEPNRKFVTFDVSNPEVMS
jgi:serine/threonine protein kinase